MHNSHLGDARATEMGERGEWNVGQLASRRLERAIGVIYRPETERPSHYFNAHVARQFDVLIHIDHTRAVEPLEREAPWTHVEPAETYPTGL